METTDKLKEIEDMIIELNKLRKDLWQPTEKLYKLRKEIALSIDLLEGLCKNIKRARKKNFDSVVEMASQISKVNDKLLDNFFEKIIVIIEETKHKVQDKWEQRRESKLEGKN